MSLEVLEQRHEQLASVDLAVRLEIERARGRVSIGGELVVTLVHVDTDPEHDTSLARLGEDPGDLAPAHEDVVRQFHGRLEPRGGADCPAQGRPATTESSGSRSLGTCG